MSSRNRYKSHKIGARARSLGRRTLRHPIFDDSDAKEGPKTSKLGTAKSSYKETDEMHTKCVVVEFCCSNIIMTYPLVLARKCTVYWHRTLCHTRRLQWAAHMTSWESRVQSTANVHGIACTREQLRTKSWNLRRQSPLNDVNDEEAGMLHGFL